MPAALTPAPATLAAETASPATRAPATPTAATPAAAAPEVERLLEEELAVCQEQQKQQEDASKLVAEFLLEEAAKRPAGRAKEPEPEPQLPAKAEKSPRLPASRAAPQAPIATLQEQTSQHFKSAEISPTEAKRSQEVAKHSRHRTIIGAVVRGATEGERAGASSSATTVPASSPKSPAWALPTSPTASSATGSMRRNQSYCAGAPASATGTVRQARQMMASQKDFAASYRIDSDAEEPAGKASKRQPSLVNAYEALGVEFHRLDQRGAEEEPMSPPRVHRSAKSGRLAPRGETRSSALSRAANFMVLDGGAAAQPSVHGGSARRPAGSEQSPPASSSGRRSRAQLRPAPSAMAADLADDGRAVAPVGPTREELARVSSLGGLPAFRSKQPLPAMSSAKPGMSEWTSGAGTGGRRLAGFVGPTGSAF